MRQFLKYTLASCLGGFLLMIFLTLAGFLMVGVFISALGPAFEEMDEQVDIKENTVLKLDLGEIIPEQTNNALNNDIFGDLEVVGLIDLMRGIKKAKEDEDIKGMIIELDAVNLGSASMVQFQDALEDFKSSGKFIYAYGNYYTQNSYFLASTADSIYLNPNGSIDFRGFGVMIPFYKTLLEKIGIEPQVFYAGEFKSATEPIRLDKMSKENRYQTSEYIRDLYNTYLAHISENRNISAEELEKMADQLLIRTADDALNYNLVDVVAYENDYIAHLRNRVHGDINEKVRILNVSKYAEKYRKKFLKSDAEDEIALVYMEGSILDEGQDPGSITPEVYVPILRKIGEDEDIKAVVIRINSGGGSALASDNISREIQLLRDSGKIVVASMGDLAASGGYYIASEADYIYALPNTLTGSIGVFGIIPNMQGLFNDKLGVYFDTVTTGPFATEFNVVDELDPSAKQIIQDGVDTIYYRFKKHVALNRNMSIEQVDHIAKGRVWSGQDALQVKLIDELGDIDAAIEKAKELAAIDAAKLKEFPKRPNAIEQLIKSLKEQNGGAPLVKTEMENWLKEELPAYKLKKELEGMRGYQMRAPFIYQKKEKKPFY